MAKKRKAKKWHQTGSPHDEALRTSTWRATRVAPSGSQSIISKLLGRPGLHHEIKPSGRHGSFPTGWTVGKARKFKKDPYAQEG